MGQLYLVFSPWAEILTATSGGSADDGLTKAPETRYTQDNNNTGLILSLTNNHNPRSEPKKLLVFSRLPMVKPVDTSANFNPG